MVGVTGVIDNFHDHRTPANGKRFQRGINRLEFGGVNASFVQQAELKATLKLNAVGEQRAAQVVDNTNHQRFTFLRGADARERGQNNGHQHDNGQEFFHYSSS